MKNPRSILAKISAAVVIVLAIGTAALAKGHSDPAFSNIHIRNFGKMDDRFYRGAQPDESDYKDENKTFCFHNGERKQPAGLQSMHFRE